MNATETTAEMFVTAFKALKRKERDAVLQELVADAELAEDLASRAGSAAKSTAHPTARCAERSADSRVTWIHSGRWDLAHIRDEMPGGLIALR